jgi:hypothetical protein
VELVKQPNNIWKLYGALKNLTTVTVQSCFHSIKSDQTKNRVNEEEPYWQSKYEKLVPPTLASEDVAAVFYKEVKEQISK